jgi:hypothetical protein
MLSLLLLFIAFPSIAQKEFSLEERRMIMDALRHPVEHALHQKVIFKVSSFQRIGEWVFMNATPLLPNGKPVDYSKIYDEDDYGENNIVALLVLKNKKWEVVEYSISPTDIPYGCWYFKHKAPKSIFPSADREEDCKNPH